MYHGFYKVDNNHLYSIFFGLYDECWEDARDFILPILTKREKNEIQRIKKKKKESQLLLIIAILIDK